MGSKGDSKSKNRGRRFSSKASNRAKEIGTFPLGVDPQRARRGLSDAQDYEKIESYFEKGIFLGDLLAKQLVLSQRITRATQTEWEWCAQAEKWRHAAIKRPTKSLVDEIENKRKNDWLMRTVLQQLGMYRHRSLHNTSADLTNPSGTTRMSVPPRVEVTMDESCKSMDGDEDPPRLQETNLLNTHGSSLDIRGNRTLRAKARLFPPMMPKLALISMKKLEQARKAVPTDQLIRVVRPNEKTVDTSDLEFNIYDKDMRYTPRRPVEMITEEDEERGSFSLSNK